MDKEHLAIAGVPEQKWGSLFSDEQALKTGTIFEELDMPFYVTEGSVKSEVLPGLQTGGKGLASALMKTKEEEEKRIAEEEAQEKMAASVVCGADGRPGTRPVGAVSQGRVNTPSQAPGTPGQAVIDYACQFIGNPYVWGGTSLTNGADCSGFVQSVYAHFGVSLPRTTYDMVNSGYAVSYEEALPGDLILYDGHVGLYMGDGTIVNAMNEADGIGICSATYTDIIAVRRVL